MKKILMASAISLTVAGTAAHAGGMTEPMVPAAVVIEDTTSNAGHILVPVLFVLFAAISMHH